MPRVAVIQSNYLPWKGYFDIIHDAELFVFYDDVQFTKNDWRNRNRIKTSSGLAWLTIPTGPDSNRLICEVVLRDPDWHARHWDILRQHYRRAAHFHRYEAFFKDIYLGQRWERLSDLNQHLITRISRELLGIQTPFDDSRRLAPSGTKLERLIDLLVKCGAREYVSGPAARAYIDERRFSEAGITLTYKDYSGYPEYPQFHPAFEHSVSIVDLLFHTGPDAPWYIWGWRDSTQAPPER
jgi:hypothetical protein